MGKERRAVPGWEKKDNSLKEQKIAMGEGEELPDTGRKRGNGRAREAGAWRVK